MNALLRIGALRALWRSGRLSWRLLRDSRTPLSSKLMLGGAILLIVSPINGIPSLIPVLGQMEDLALLGLALNLFLKRVPAELRREHEAALSYDASKPG
ncbi:MAG: YkvA family protein [Chloroflexota bacterium]